MNCTKCGEAIDGRSGYFRTRKGAHHFQCGISNLPDQVTHDDALIEQMIAMYDHRGPSTTRFEAMREIALLAVRSGRPANLQGKEPK